MSTRWLFTLVYVFMAVTWWLMLGSKGLGSRWWLAVWAVVILVSAGVALTESRKTARAEEVHVDSEVEVADVMVGPENHLREDRAHPIDARDVTTSAARDALDGGTTAPRAAPPTGPADRR